MDGMWEFIKAMTLWNWLSLIAFIFFPLSALNAFFSLRSRYKDWRATSSTKRFEKRLKELETLVNMVGTYRNEPTRYYSLVIDFIATIMIMSLESGVAFVFAFIITTFFMKNLSLLVTSLVICLVFLVGATIHANRLLWSARYVHVPELLKEEVLKFLASGIKKGLVPKKGGKDIVELLFHHKMVTENEYEEVKKLLDKLIKPQ
jgi:hypothetical protein